MIEIGPRLGGALVLYLILFWYVAWALRELGHRWLDQQVPEVSEDEASVVVPDDLAALALGETEKWAQDSVMATIREKWDQYGDWNKVRAALGVATRDDA